MAILFDNHDSRIRYIELILERMDLEDVKEYPLPDGYRYVFYRDGDRDSWIDIEISAKELRDHAQGVEVWERYYRRWEEILHERMVFIENEHGEKVATATAYFDPFGDDPPEIGVMHWVAVRRDHQGLGLARPLISHTLSVMKGLGYTHTKIHTQTNTWVAVRLYLDFGFRPTKENFLGNKLGWEILHGLIEHPALKGVRKAEIGEILDKETDDGT